jgi:hypothetical protein
VGAAHSGDEKRYDFIRLLFRVVFRFFVVDVFEWGVGSAPFMWFFRRHIRIVADFIAAPHTESVHYRGKFAAIAINTTRLLKVNRAAPEPPPPTKKPGRRKPRNKLPTLKKFCP